MKNLNVLLHERSNNKTNFCIGRVSFLILLVTLNIGSAIGQFLPSTVQNKVFPLPIQVEPIPTSTTGALYWPTFYNERNNGSCYSTTADFTTGIAGNENIYVWAINHIDVIGYEHAVAYEVTDVSHNILYRGTAFVGGDVANLQVGIYTPNGTDFHLVVAYWRPGPSGGDQIELRDYTIDATFGLISPVTTVLYSLSNTTGFAQHISLDCHNINTFTVAWEDEGYPLHIVGFDYDAISTITGQSPVRAVGTVNSRFPDIAMSGDITSSPTAPTIDIHLACLDKSTSPATIEEYKIDFGSLYTTPFITPENTNIIVGGFGPFWDDFTLRIDAPDNYSGNPKWAYTYFDDDANKIKVRINNVGLYYNVVMNDGISLPGLINLTDAGNAFPTITWNNTSDEIYVGWYTNYDNTLPGPPAPNNPLYTYTTNTEGYISALIDDVGNAISNRYSNVDAANYANFIGKYIDPFSPYTNMYRPKICFSKNNECAQMFALFSSHENKPSLIWPYPSTFQGRYWEAAGITPTSSSSPIEESANINYAGSTYPVPSGFSTSVFLSQKQVDWYNGSTGTLFKKVPKEDIISTKDEELNIRSNPFCKEQVFQLNGGDASAEYVAELKSIDGKKIADYQGSVSTLNATFKTMNTDLLPAGIYTLSVSSGKENIYEFKLVKQ
ncbi:MAG: hypothetical protein WC716_14300 [Chitinophagaceae bacterium]